MQQYTFPRIAVCLIALVSAGALGTAYVAQYGFALLPCHLCLWQRLPYDATLILGLFGLAPAVDDRTRRQIILWSAVFFAINAGLGAYHAGVEYRWWAGPTSCTGRADNFDITDLAAALNKPGQTSCEDAAFRLFGISMAGFNAFSCTLFAAACAWAGTRKNKWGTS